MASGNFFLGFATALLVVAALLLAAFYMRRARWQRSNIKGYLDLIPDLSGEQRQKVQKIRETFLPKVEGIRQDLCQLRIDLAEALFSDPTDRDRVHSVARKILGRQSELEWEVIEHILEEKDILSQKQQKDFYEIILQQFSHGGLGVHDVKGRKRV